MVFLFVRLQLPWPSYQNRFAMDPRFMSHQAAMAAYNLNLRPTVSRASPVLYGLGQPSSMGIGQLPTTDKELLPEPNANGRVTILKFPIFFQTINKHK